MGYGNPQQKVIDYFNSWESLWGYTLVLGGTKHFGYYPKGQENLLMREAQKLMEDKLAERLDLEENSLVLDAGCGEGSVAIHLVKNHRFRIEGVDLIDLAIKRAEQKVSDFGLQNSANFQVMDYTNLGFDNNYFDGIYTMESLVHAPDYRQALRQFCRVLRPKGKLVLFEYSICPAKKLTNYQKNLMDMVIEESGMHSLPHFLHGEFPEILEEAGFADVSVDNITPRIMPMLRRFFLIACLPYQLIKLLGLQRKFINATAATEGYRNIGSDVWRYNIVAATKPE